ncbi:hypothetical protein K402DRAFT_457090 [Aulographum hederae CBS 113979]|uniref:Zn(2)-C6 fungal-type domain-containing protein n=1 Tax=Aulographum hederae CBS 113979 TaxID=1176131 RepID=A0A6G1GP63_9PEZI|nr:hypothetical protein K402DRAFT_457090 [Aulographum hederae CBS 113979]
MDPPPAVPSPQSTSATNAPARPRRPRAVQACNYCRSKKYRCDGAYPCSPCRKHGAECVFKSPQAGGAAVVTYSQSYVKSLEQRLAAAEASLAQFGSRNGTPGPIPSPQPEQKGSNEPLTLSPSSSRTHTSADQPRNQSRELDSDRENEVMNINPLTREVEFHGGSSSVAFLDRVREQYGERSRQTPNETHSESASTARALNNDQFTAQQDSASEWNDAIEHQFFSPHTYVFLDTYFHNLHYIHPILDQGSFLRRCEDLWSGHPERQSRSFIALYFSVSALGALIRTWTEVKINGMGRFEWSRMLFDRAIMALGKAGSLNDLEAVQALILVAKVCQNELNPNLAYTYLGLATRKALSIGLNRDVFVQSGQNAHQPDKATLSKTWWGLYSLEVELSFALGRPDGAGPSLFHNRPVPPLEDSESDILAATLGLANIMRETAVRVYLVRASLNEKLDRAFEIQKEIDSCIVKLPSRIRPSGDRTVENRTILGDPDWARVQRLAVTIRFNNVQMLLFRPFILEASKLKEADTMPQKMEEAIELCTTSAVTTIETIFEAFRLHAFFRTWWYNITYLTFAASIILYRAAQPPRSEKPTPDYVLLINKTLNILEVMDESIVARNTAEVLRKLLAGLRRRTGHDSDSAIDRSTPARSIMNDTLTRE